VLRVRLQKRGRESAAEIEERLQRAAAYRLDGPDVVQLNNDGPLSEGVATFVALLEKRG
jgi:ribose 1,5-bisphosphokinase PhnN